MPIRAVYQENPREFREREKTRRIRNQPRVSAQELERLCLPANRLEALWYGPAKKCVCLYCGLICDNLSRHISACPKKPRKDFDSDGYRERWGYNKSNPLTSAEWQKERSETFKRSEKFQAAQERNRTRWQVTAAAQRESVSTAKFAGGAIRRGPLRAETISRRTGRRLLSRPLRQKVPDSVIAKIIALDLSIAEGAKLAVFTDTNEKRRHLSQTAFYRRAQRFGWQASQVKARRALVLKYVFELRAWLRNQQQLPTLEQVIQWHVSGLQGGTAMFQEFQPFSRHLEAELKGHPEWLEKLLEKNSKAGAVIALASKVFQRARVRKRQGAPKKSKPEHIVFGEVVNHVLARFRAAFGILAKAKKENSLSADQCAASLRASGYSGPEISAVLASRKPKATAVRWASARSGKSLKTGKNLYRLALLHSQSPEEE